MDVQLSNRINERQRLWDAAQRADELREEGSGELGARALSMFKENSVKSILVLGCGQESDAMYFAKNGLCTTTIDFSSVGQDKVGRAARLESTTRCGGFLAQNIRDNLPEPGSSVDAIYSKLFLCMDLQEEEIKDILWQCLHVLKPGGLKVFSVFSDRDPDCGKATKCGEDEWKTDRGFVAHYFTEDKIRKLARSFDVLWVREYQEGEPPDSGVRYEVVLMKPKRT